MREIKFRAQRLVTKEWVYGDLIKHSKIDPFTYIAIGTWYKINDPEIGKAIKVYPHTVGQLTDIKDKNGKEIYEGDIVTDGKPQSDHCLAGTHEVKFVDGAFFPFAVAGWECTMEHDRCEIIGNIYENPELLNV